MPSASIKTTRATLICAIQIEERNCKIYNSLAQLFSGYDDSVAAIFLEMAAEERQHGTELEQRFQDRFGPVPSPAGEPKEVIEAPDLEDPEAMIFDSMTVETALEAVLHAEEAAREFYRREISRAGDSELQELYRELADYEETHATLLKEKLAEKRRAPSALLK